LFLLVRGRGPELFIDERLKPAVMRGTSELLRATVMAHRIAVVGVSGKGTTLARRLAEQLDVPYTELDALCHRPGWVEASDEDFRRDVEAAMNHSDGWVLDGSYQWKLGDLVLQRADTIVWLDQPPMATRVPPFPDPRGRAITVATRSQTLATKRCSSEPERTTIGIRWRLS
jgi:hypothetical protein